jgi:DNA-binding transcriptional MerR regulator
MKTYTVAAVARLAGISVRALHHYDEIGLLKPAFTGANGYRYYGEDELLRLQQILIHRELDIPLAEIGTLLDRPSGDRLRVLIEQRQRLEGRARHYAGLVATIDRTIARLKGEASMDDAELYKGVVSPEKQVEYEQWLEERYGPAVRERIEHGRAVREKLSPMETEAMMTELRAVEAGLVDAMQRGIAVDSTELAPLMERHRRWVGRSWDGPVTGKAYAGLADLYLAHPDFVARYESLAPGFARYLSDVMHAEAARLPER